MPSGAVVHCWEVPLPEAFSGLLTTYGADGPVARKEFKGKKVSLINQFNFFPRVNLKTQNALLATKQQRKQTTTTMTTPMSMQHHADNLNDPPAESQTDRQDHKSADKGKLLSVSIRQ